VLFVTGHGDFSTCEFHELVVRELVSATDERKILSVATRTVYILSVGTDPRSSTTHCSAVTVVSYAKSSRNYIADSYHVLYVYGSITRPLPYFYISSYLTPA